MKEHACDVFLRNAVLLFEGSSKTTSGLWINSPPCVALDYSSPMDIIGETVLDVLGQSQHGVPHPTGSKKGSESALFRAAGVRTLAEFAKGARSCSVRHVEELIRFIPTRNEGRGSFLHLPDGIITVAATDTPEKIGSALVKALGQSA